MKKGVCKRAYDLDVHWYLSDGEPWNDDAACNLADWGYKRREVTNNTVIPTQNQKSCCRRTLMPSGFQACLSRSYESPSTTNTQAKKS